MNMVEKGRELASPPIEKLLDFVQNQFMFHPAVGSRGLQRPNISEQTYNLDDVL